MTASRHRNSVAAPVASPACLPLRRTGPRHPTCPDNATGVRSAGPTIAMPPPGAA